MRPPRLTLPKPTDRLPLGETGLQVSPFCIGMVGSDEVACAAFDAGINFFFVSADLHWPLYEPTRRGLERLFARGTSVREQVVVAVASYVTQPDFVNGPFTEILQFLPGLGAVDVAIAGGTYSWDVAVRSERFRQLRELGRFGVRAAGMTFHHRRAALQAVNERLVDIAFSRYNPVHLGGTTDLYPHLLDDRSTLLFNFKSMMGLLTSDQYERLNLPPDRWRPRPVDYYRFALTRPEIDGILCAPKTPHEVLGIIRAMEDGPLTTEEHDILIDLGSR